MDESGVSLRSALCILGFSLFRAKLVVAQYPGTFQRVNLVVLVRSSGNQPGSRASLELWIASCTRLSI